MWDVSFIPSLGTRTECAAAQAELEKDRDNGRDGLYIQFIDCV